MSLIPKDEAEFLRLKMKMEIIRTVCPMIMILIQLFIIIEIYWKLFHVEHAKNQKSAKKQICGFFYFSEKIEKNQNNAWLYDIFGAGAPVVRQRLF